MESIGSYQLVDSNLLENSNGVTKPKELVVPFVQGTIDSRD